MIVKCNRKKKSLCRKKWLVLVWIWTNSFCTRHRIYVKCCIKSLREFFAGQMFIFLSRYKTLLRMKKHELTGPKMLKWENGDTWLALLITWGLEIPFLLNRSGLVIFLFFLFFRVHAAPCPYFFSPLCSFSLNSTMGIILLSCISADIDYWVENCST